MSLFKVKAKKYWRSSFLVFLFILGFQHSAEAQSLNNQKPRIVVTCDPELDDSNSLIRFLLYSTDFDVQGLVYASSQFHWKGDGKGTKWFVEGREYTRFGLNMGPMESWRWADDERFIHDAVEAYETVYPNLVVHNKDYPYPAYLKSIIKWGNIEFDGVFDKDTEGSDHIKSLILDDHPGPLYLMAWGGASTIARALKSIEDEFSTRQDWEQLKSKIENKIILCLSGDQDNSYENYIQPQFPGIEILASTLGNVPLAYNAQNRVSEKNQVFYSPEWTHENIVSKGPLGALYRVWGDGKQMVKDDIFDFFGFSGVSEQELKDKGYIVWTPLKEKGAFLGEGDSHTFLNLISNGLRAHESQYYGGWAGRKTRGVEVDQTLIIAREEESEVSGLSFIPAVQNGFAARMHWSVTPEFKSANHYPVIKGPLHLVKASGKTFKLNLSASDPDNDELKVRWVHYENEGYNGSVEIENPTHFKPSITVPEGVAKGTQIHLVAKVVDNGLPSLTVYHRVIVEVK